MITHTPRYLSLFLFVFLPLVIYFRSNVNTHIPHLRRPKTEKPNEVVEAALSSNATNFVHDGVFDDTAEGAPRIAQVSMQYGDNFDLMYERGLRTHIVNGERWGYPTHFLRHDIIGKGEGGQGVYDKLLYLQTIMVNEMTKPFGKRAEWIVWFDADTVLLNNNIPWTIFLPPNEGLFREINMLITADWQGFNAGVFLIRVCEWSIMMLSDAIAIPRLKPDINLSFAEQDAVKYMYNLPENLKHRLYTPKHWFNGYDTYYAARGEVVMRGQLIVHFPGMSGARTDAMGRWLDKIDNFPEEMQIPLENTTYPQEIEAYWGSLRGAAEMLQRANDYREEVSERHKAIWNANGGKIANSLGDSEGELEKIMQEKAFEKDKMHDAVVKLDEKIRATRKAVEEGDKKKKDESDGKKKKEVEQKEAKAKAIADEKEKAKLKADADADAVDDEGLDEGDEDEDEDVAAGARRRMRMRMRHRRR